MRRQSDTGKAMTTELAKHSELERLATSLVKSGMFGLTSTDQAIALMAIAQAEGKHPAIIARDFHIIQGRPAKKAEAMLRDFVAGGGRVEWHALDDTIADASFSHPQGGTVRIGWDLERAKKAGLVDKSGGMYSKYPRAMLRSRCISEGVRTVGPFATSGVYTPEELQTMTTTAREPIKDVGAEDQTPPYLDIGVVLDHCAAIEGAADLEELKATFKAAYGAAKSAGDFKAVEQFERKKDSRKRELTAEDAV
jgi:hypothetical protein